MLCRKTLKALNQGLTLAFYNALRVSSWVGMFVAIGFVAIGFVAIGFVAIGFVAIGFVAIVFVAIVFVAIVFVAAGS